MKNYVLYNPIAGSGKGARELERACELCRGECVSLNVTEIESYPEFLEALEPDDTIVICGGDGTVNRFVNSIGDTEIKNDVFYYAAGTGNDFLHDIDGADAHGLVKINEYIKDLPTVEVNGQSYKFINGVGYGIDGYCCEVGDALRAKSDKPVNYTAIAIKGLLFYYKPSNATVTVDGNTYEYKKVWIAPTMNGRFYGGGMMPTPKQDRLNPERKVSLMLFHGTGKLKTLMIFPSLFKGEHVKHTEAVAIHEGKEITVKFDKPTPLQIDGETILGVTEYTVRTRVPAKV